jgi:hypothetical protein
MNRRSNRNIANRQRITHFDRRFGTANNLLTNRETTRRDHVATLAVRVENERNVGRPIRIVLKPFNFTDDTVFVPLEIDDTVVLLVTATLMTSRHMPVIVSPGILGLSFYKAGKRGAFMQPRRHNLDNRTPSRRSWLYFDERHYAAPPSTKLIS